MYHFYDVVINDKTGVPLSNVIIRIYDDAGVIVPLFANETGSTPIEVVSGLANAAVTDNEGNYDFYVADGTYDIRFFVGDAVLKVLANILMGFPNVDGKAQAAALGVTGSAVNMGTFTGSTIPDNVSAKQALQALETEVEGKQPLIAPGTTADYYRGDKTFQALNASAVVGLGTAATQNIGTYGANVPLLNRPNIWSGSQTFSALNANITLSRQGAGLEGGQITYGYGNGVAGDWFTDVDNANNFRLYNTDPGGTINAISVSPSTGALSLATPLPVASGGTGGTTEKANASALGVTGSAANMGTFTGAIIPDNQTGKQALQALETATEGRPTSVVLAAPDGASLVGFLQSGTGGVQETVADALSREVWVDQFKAVIDVDDTACIERAIATGAAVVRFTDRDYFISDRITVPGYRTLRGAGRCFDGALGKGTRIVQTDLTKGAFFFDLTFAQAGGFSDMTIMGDVPWFLDPGSTGVAVEISNSNDGFTAERFDIIAFDKQVLITGGYYPKFTDFRLLGFRDYGIHYGPQSVGNDIQGSFWNKGKISNTGFTGDATSSKGIWLHQGSGEYFTEIDITECGQGVCIDPPTGTYVRFINFTNVRCDSSYYENWFYDGGQGGYILNIRNLGCWASGAGGGANRPVGSVRGAGLLTTGPEIDDATWIGGELRDNDCSGWRHEGGKNVRLSGVSISRNSRRLGFDNQYPGVAIAANISEWSVHNCRIGNFSEGVFAVEQAEAIVIEAGASQNFQITDNDLREPGAGKACIANGSSTLNWIIKDNLPAQTPFVSYTKSAKYSGTSIGTVPANGARYLSMAGQQTIEDDAYIVMSDPGWARQFIVQVAGAPGVGQSFTYTVRKNGIATVMTGAISGDGTFQLISQTGFSYNAGDYLSIEVITSATAATVRHRWSLAIEG